MGGNFEVKGNSYVSVEFNFYFDVEVVYIVLNKFICLVFLVIWEFCLNYVLFWEFYDLYIG